MGHPVIHSASNAFFSAIARTGLSAVFLLGASFDAVSQETAIGEPGVEAVTYSGPKVKPHEFTGDVRDLPPAPATEMSALEVHRHMLPPRTRPKIPPLGAQVEEMAPAAIGPLTPMPSPTQNFAGVSRTDTCTGGQCGPGIPPDPNGDVGPNHYIQGVNRAYAIYSKTGTLIASFTENQLWSGIGATPCNGYGRGDPIVLYDALADRWILTHIAHVLDSNNKPAPPFYECIAVSKTGDPVAGGWYFYPVQMDPGGAGKPPAGTLHDYPKFGVWTDCIYMSANGYREPADTYRGVVFASFSRADLYGGAPLTWSVGFITADTTYFDPLGMIPSNLSGKAAASVPAGTPNYYVSESMAVQAFEVRKFTPGPNCGSGGTIGTATNVSQAGYILPGIDNVPQPDTTNTLDNFYDVLLQKVQYRKVGVTESLWVVHSVQTPDGSIAPQWAQIDVTGGAIATTPLQQQIYRPDTTLFRWMGSLAVDNQGNMALGYSTSGRTSPNYPSIAYSGRLATDPLNTLPQAEAQLVAGLGSQTNDCKSPSAGRCARWGDYTAMSVDPTDDCTFWYTNQYYSSLENGASGNWQTRIGSFSFPSCTASIFNSQSNCMFNWAEGNFPSLFPTGATSVTLAPFFYRYYAQTNTYLGTSSADGHVYYLGPLTNFSIFDVGPMSPLLSMAGCQ